jgi:hypothetical protein
LLLETLHQINPDGLRYATSAQRFPTSLLVLYRLQLTAACLGAHERTWSAARRSHNPILLARPTTCFRRFAQPQADCRPTPVARRGGSSSSHSTMIGRRPRRRCFSLLFSTNCSSLRSDSDDLVTRTPRVRWLLLLYAQRKGGTARDAAQARAEPHCPTVR